MSYHTTLHVLSLFVVFAAPVVAGPFPSHRDTGVMPEAIVAWANQVHDYAPTAEVVTIDQFGGGPHDEPAHALGAPDRATVSLGDLDAQAIANGATPGQITVGFNGLIYDGPGGDLAIFENAGLFFDDYHPDFVYAELAFVEVSSDGVHFARFQTSSLNIEPDSSLPDPDFRQLYAEFGRDFAGINTTNVDGFAGVHPALKGTEFDLADLSDHPLVDSGLLDLDRVAFVRMVDIPGNGSYLDSSGNPIYDTWKTVESGGLDLDAVGAIHIVPEPSVAVLLAGALVCCRLLVRTESPIMLKGKSSRVGATRGS